MAEPSATTAKKSTSQTTRSQSLQSSPGSTPAAPTHLETDRGVTSIDSSVVAKIASLASREVEGVAALGGTVSSALASVVGRIRGDEHRTAGVGVEVGARQAAVDLSLSVQYPSPIPDVTQSVRENVIDRVQSLTGLEVVEVNIAVTDLAFPGSQEEGDVVEPSRVE